MVLGSASSARSSWLDGKIGWAVLAVLALAGLALMAWHWPGRIDAPRALVPADGWTMAGDFKADSRYSDPLHVPAALQHDPALRFWRALGPPDNPPHGEVHSAPFDPPPFLAVPYGGFPDEVEGNRIVLQCMGTGTEYPVSRFRMNDLRATSFIALPPDFCAGQVRLSAYADGRQFIAVGTPFAISEAAYRGQTNMLPRLLVVFGAWILALPVWFVSAFLLKRGGPALGPVAAGMIGSAVLGMAMLSAFTFGPNVGETFVHGVAIALALGTVAIIVADRRWSLDFVRGIALPAGLWLAVALFMAGVVSAADNGGGAWWINALFTPVRWSSDNQIPYQLAEGLVSGLPFDQLKSGPWLATDRTPLMAALLMPIRVLLIRLLERDFGDVFVPVAYMMSSIVILSAWVAVIVEIVRRLDPRRLAVVLILAATTPFLFFNSVYAWPKLLGAAHVLIVFDLLLDLSRTRRRDPFILVMIALASMAAILAHSSNALALVPLALIFARTLLRQGFLAILAGACAAIVLYLPWLYWQIAIQPGGNALLRFALANDTDANNRTRPLLAAIVEAYRAMSFDEWLAGKWETIALMLGLAAPDFGMSEMASNSPAAGLLGTARIYDFLSVGHALSIAGLGVVLVPFLPIFARADDRYRAFTIWAAIAGIGGVAALVLLLLPPGIVHQQAYGALLLILVAGAMAIAAAPAWLAGAAALVSTAYFGVVWIWHPIVNALTVHTSALAVMAWALMAIGWMLICARREAPAS